MDNNLKIMRYTLVSGIVHTIPINNDQLKEWIEIYQKKGVYVLSVGSEVYGLNAELIADFQVRSKFSELYPDLLPIKKLQAESQAEEKEDVLFNAYVKKTSPFQLQCKCGADYLIDLPYYTTKYSCKDCFQMCFLDKKANKIHTELGFAGVITNRYFVERHFSNNNLTDV